MKLKFTQSTYVDAVKRVLATGEEYVIEDIRVAESLIKAGYAKLAEEVEKVEPKKERKPRATQTEQPKTDGEQ